MKTNKNVSLIDGILLFNKAEGVSSNGALQKLKHLFGAKKAGHTGSLDPLATGMLPICFGEATKISQYLLNADKCYETTGLLGIKTNTADSTGEPIAVVNDFCIPVESLSAILTAYKGSSKQIPSMFSALKHQGVPLYRFARKGIEIERAARDILISELRLDKYDGKQFSLTVTCSKGTYIRNLVEDIGDALNVGAHVTRLHRLYTSGFADRPMYTLDELIMMSEAQRLACLIPMDVAVTHFRSIILTNEEILIIRQGRVVKSKMPHDKEECVRLYDEHAKFIGLGESQSNGDIKAKRLLSFHFQPETHNSVDI